MNRLIDNLELSQVSYSLRPKDCLEKRFVDTQYT